jgi:hypothetical protein
MSAHSAPTAKLPLLLLLLLLQLQCLHSLMLSIHPAESKVLTRNPWPLAEAAHHCTCSTLLQVPILLTLHCRLITTKSQTPAQLWLTVPM